MKNVKTLAASVLLLVGLSTASEAAICSNSFYRNVISRANSLEGQIARCQRTLNRNPGINRMCAVCGPTFARIDRLERDLRRNKSCFSGDRNARRAIAKLSSIKGELRFLRRGCGY